MQKNQGNCDFSLEKEEVKCTLSVPMLTRYQTLPLNRINWGQQCDVTGKSVCHNTGRNKLNKSLQYFHVSDSNDFRMIYQKKQRQTECLSS